MGPRRPEAHPGVAYPPALGARVLRLGPTLRSAGCPGTRRQGGVKKQPQQKQTAPRVFAGGQLFLRISKQQKHHSTHQTNSQLF
jgi:hypothetical protein